MSHDGIGAAPLDAQLLDGIGTDSAIPDDLFSFGAGGFGLGPIPISIPVMGAEASTDVSYSFSVSSDTLTETVTSAHGTQTLTFTQETSDTSLYQLTSIAVSGFECSAANAPASGGSSDGSASSNVTYGFSGVGTASMTETITAANETVTLVYTQESGSTSEYQISSETINYTSTSTSAPSATYSFTESNGTVTAISETVTHGSHSNTFSLTLNPSAVFTIDSGSGSVSETFAVGNTVQTDVYTASGSDYVLSSATINFIAQGSATTALDVNPYDRYEFTITNGTVTAAEYVSPSGTVTSVPTNSHVSFSQLATGFVEETVTFGSHSNYVVFAEGSGGIYTEVAHGSGSSVDLVGLQAQLAQLPTAVAALV